MTLDIARLRRLAQNLRPHGEPLLDWLTTNTIVEKFVLAAEIGMPPVAMISDHLPQELHPALEDERIRRFIGTVIAAVLGQRGWVVERTGVRVPDPDSRFSTGAIYKRAPADPTTTGIGTGDLLDAMIAGLSATQRQALVGRIQALSA